MLTITQRNQRHDYFVPFKVDRYHINIRIKDQLAITRIDQTFTNPNEFEVDGRYIFPVPDGAVVSNLALSIDGDPVEGHLLSSERSYRTYRRSIREGHNLGIIEHIGTQAFVADVRRIPANNSRHVEFEYSQILPEENALVKYTHPLSLAKSENCPVADLVVNMEIESQHELGTINSAAHEVTIDRKNDNHVQISYKGTDVDPDDDFQCYYSVSNNDFGITLLTHRYDEIEDGYFMLLISPKYEVKKTEAIEKDFIFVLDHSGSMMRRKIEQAKGALRFCVNNLNEGDRFNLILFNTDITSFADRLYRQDLFSIERSHPSGVLSDHLIDIRDGQEEAIAFIEGIEAGGGTNINEALLKALSEKPDPNRPRIIVFLTDGCPTAGVTNPTQILNNVAQANNNQSHIFVFGVGYDLNVRFLDELAADNGGSRNYVEPHENIEEAVSSLSRKMNEPVLVNVEVDFGQIITKELTPINLPNLYREEQLMLLGRYKGHGDTVIKLLGTIGDEQQTFQKNVKFSDIEMDNDHLPHLWAQLRVNELGDQAALMDNRDSEKLRKEIERLCLEFDVLTQDTSFVLADDDSYRRHYSSDIHQVYNMNRSIDDLVKRSKIIEKRKSDLFKTQETDTKYIGRKAFYQKDGIWVDTKYDGQSERKIIKFASDEYFELVSQSSELAKCLKLSRSMIICYKGVSYEITPSRSSF